MAENFTIIGHCGRIFHEGEICPEVFADDLCVGCPMNDDECEDGEYDA